MRRIGGHVSLHHWLKNKGTEFSRPPNVSPRTVIGEAPHDGYGCRAMTKEIHSAARAILAKPPAIFRAYVDPEALVKWRAPAGMR